MMLFKIKTLGLFLLIFATSLLAQRFAARQGDFWTGGDLSYTSLRASNGTNRLNVLGVNPITRYFPIAGLCVGPTISWTGEYMGGYSSNNWGLGGEMGYVGKGVIIAYCMVSPHYIFSNNSSNEGSASAATFWLPCTGGVIFPLGSSLGLEMELGYGIGFHGGGNADVFTIGFGFCGLANKILVSVVNAVRIMPAAW